MTIILPQSWSAYFRRFVLGAKLKVPRPISSSGDEQAINLFKKTFPWQ
jgi:hypothetical protein